MTKSFLKIFEVMSIKASALLIFMLLFFVNCQKQLSPIEISAEDFHLAQDELTAIMVHDIFSPPLASRVYAYSNIAAYEILAQKKEYPYSTYARVLNGFQGVSPAKDSLVDHKLSALIAFLEVGKISFFQWIGCQPILMAYHSNGRNIILKFIWLHTITRCRW